VLNYLTVMLVGNVLVNVSLSLIAGQHYQGLACVRWRSVSDAAGSRDVGELSCVER